MTWGKDKWGQFPWGTTDWAEKVLYDNVPELYKNYDVDNEYRLQKFLASWGNILNNFKRYIDLFLNLGNPFKVRKELLKSLAGNFDVTIYDGDVESFQRSSIANAYKWYKIKGVFNAYRSIARMYGFDVFFDEIFRKTIGPDSYTNIPPWYRPFIQSITGDTTFTNDYFSGEVKNGGNITLYDDINGEIIGTGDGLTKTFNKSGLPLDYIPIMKRSITVIGIVGGGNIVGIDDGEGNIVGIGITGTINYTTGMISVIFDTAPDNGTNIKVNYKTGIIKIDAWDPVNKDNIAYLVFKKYKLDKDKYFRIAFRFKQTQTFVGNPPFYVPVVVYSNTEPTNANPGGTLYEMRHFGVRIEFAVHRTFYWPSGIIVYQADLPSYINKYLTGVIEQDINNNVVRFSILDDNLQEITSDVIGDNIGTGDGLTTTFSDILVKPPVKKKTLVITTVLVGDISVTGTDDGNGNIIGNHISSGTIDYAQGAISITFDSAVRNLEPILANYIYISLAEMSLDNRVNLDMPLWVVLGNISFIGSENMFVYSDKFIFEGIDRDNKLLRYFNTDTISVPEWYKTYLLELVLSPIPGVIPPLDLKRALDLIITKSNKNDPIHVRSMYPIVNIDLKFLFNTKEYDVLFLDNIFDIIPADEVPTEDSNTAIISSLSIDITP